MAARSIDMAAKIASPFTAATVAVPLKVPGPVPILRVIVVVADETTFPKASYSLTRPCRAIR